MRRFLACVVAAALGVVTGTAATLVHHIGAMLVLAFAATLATCWACPPGWVRVVYALTWVVPVGLAAVPRAEGDYLVGSDARGFGLLGLAMLVVSVAVVTIPRRDPPAVTDRVVAGESTA